MTAHIIPYIYKGGIYYFFLQKRSDNAERNPGGLTIFGGGIEKGETAEGAMLRESKEELDYIPSNYIYVGEYSDDYSISYYYAVEVKDDFEASIKIGEGDYGIFFSEEGIKKEIKLSENNKKILSDLIKKIRDNRHCV
jgi:8-oxo-dGTP pyrophosphatase MutT (NUDIX family)